MTLVLCIQSIQVGVVATIPMNSNLWRCAAPVEVAEIYTIMVMMIVVTMGTVAMAATVETINPFKL